MSHGAARQQRRKKEELRGIDTIPCSHQAHSSNKKGNHGATKEEIETAHSASGRKRNFTQSREIPTEIEASAMKRSRNSMTEWNRLTLFDTCPTNPADTVVMATGVDSENPQRGEALFRSAMQTDADTTETTAGDDSLTIKAEKNISASTAMSRKDSTTRISRVSSLHGHSDDRTRAANNQSTPTCRQVSFESSRLTPSSSCASGCSVYASSSDVTDVTSSFLSMSPMHEFSAKGTPAVINTGCDYDANAKVGWSPVSITETGSSHAHQQGDQYHKAVDTTCNDNTTTCTIGRRIYNASGLHAAWRNKKRTASLSSDSNFRVNADANGLSTGRGSIRYNRKRSLHRLPPSKCLASLAQEVSILDDDYSDGDGEDDDATRASESLMSLPGSLCDSNRPSFNTRPYKRQPSSGEWCHHQGAPYQKHNSQGGGGSVSPTLSMTSSTSSHSTSIVPGSDTNVLLSRSAPTKMGEWGQFVEVVGDTEDQSNTNSSTRAQPLAFSPGFGGCSRSSSRGIGRCDSSGANLPYYPKSSRRRGSSSSCGRRSNRRRASSVGSQHDIVPPISFSGAKPRRFALTPRSSKAATAASSHRGVVADNTTYTTDGKESPFLFLGRKNTAASSIFSSQDQLPISSSHNIAPPPSPSFASLEASGKDATIAAIIASNSDLHLDERTESPLTPRPSLDDVASALDHMQV